MNLWDPDALTVVDTCDMAYPMRCKWCGCVHDAGKVEVVQRYADCSVWRCPGCGLLIDVICFLVVIRLP